MNKRTNILSFDLSKFKKIEDIIFLDEPILTHYKRNDRDFLMYLVDTLEESDIFLLFEIDENTIYNYLNRKISLRSIIKSNQNFAYIIEQGFDGVLLNVNVTQCESIDENYLPNNDSFLSFEPTKESYYYNFIQEYQKKTYLNYLREKAFYIKIALKNAKYADTIGFNELANIFLSNISLSFKSFLKADFFESFKKIITDENILNTIFNKLLPDLDYRMVDLKYNSFEIGLSIDKVMNTIEDKKIKEWSNTVGEKYHEIILNDFDEQKVERIVKAYNEEDRKKIFNPIFKITENKDYKLLVKPNKESPYTRIQVRDRSIIERIVPDKVELIIRDEDKDYQIINVTTVVDKNKTKKSINLEETLFDSSNQANVILKNKDFEKFGFIVDFEISVEVEIRTEKNLIHLIAKFDSLEFETKISTGKLDDGIQKITNMIYEYILNSNDSTSV